MSRLPIRARLTAIFVVVMGVVLAIIGSFLYYRTKVDLDDSIAQSLRARQGALRSYAASARAGAARAIPPGEGFAQLLTPGGRVLASRPDGAAAVITPAEARAAARAVQFSELHEHFRYLAGPSRLQGARVVAVAGASLADRERALEGLGGALLIGGPLALLVAALIAYATAAAALRPVEALRRQAATISRADVSARLPVSEVDDELQRLSRTLNEMLARITRSAELEREFVANASHELRTPLAALKAELELAERHPGTAAEMSVAMRRTHQDVDRLIALTNGLLALATAEADRAPVRDRLDVDDLLVAAAEAARPRAVAAGRTVTAQPSGLRVVGDEVAIRRAIDNLLDNALVHGTGAVHLGAGTVAGRGSVELWVQDAGRLEPGLQARAFERFARGRETARTPGAGLGLALVEATARDHGGSASLDDLPDGGVRATLRLPSAGS